MRMCQEGSLVHIDRGLANAPRRGQQLRVCSALDPVTGEPQWEDHLGFQSGAVELGLGNKGTTVFAVVAGNDPDGNPQDIALSITQEAVLVTANTPGGQAVGLTAEDGGTLWKTEMTSTLVPEPNLLALDPATGDLLWRKGFAGPLSTPAISGDGAVYVITGSDETVAFELSDGAERWRSGAAGEAPPIPRGGSEGPGPRGRESFP